MSIHSLTWRIYFTRALAPSLRGVPLPDDVNRITLDSYDVAPERYEERTPSQLEANVKDWIDAALQLITTGAEILEIGSGTGRDARYIESKGFRVQRTEASDGLIRLLESKGESVSKLNLLTDPIEGNYDLVIANAVLHHVPESDISNVLAKVRNCLTSNGVFAFCTKEGSGEFWESDKLEHPRYFRLWTADEMESLLTHAGLETHTLAAGVVSSNGERWLQVISRKA